jgi:hypothetical protein
MEEFGDAMTGGIGSTRNSSSMTNRSIDRFLLMITKYFKQTPWPWIVVLPFVSVVAAGTLVLFGWIGLALLGY